jgi:hypothetical protein
MLLILGLTLGWGMATIRPAAIRASGGDRSGETIITTGPIMIAYDVGSKVQVPHDAVYILDYKAGKLLGTVPSSRQAGRGNIRYLSNIMERDLAADFKLDAHNVSAPRFTMTTGGLGAFSNGWAPLYVHESVTNQLALYRLVQQTRGTVDQSRLELLEMRAIASPIEPAQNDR